MKICSFKCKSKSFKGFSPTAQVGKHGINECSFYIKNHDLRRKPYVAKSIDGFANGQHGSLPLVGRASIRVAFRFYETYLTQDSSIKKNMNFDVLTHLGN